MLYRRVLAGLGTLFALVAAVLVAANAGNAAGQVTTTITPEPTACVECAECDAGPTPAPLPTLTSMPEAALRYQQMAEPSDPPQRWDRFQYTFRVDIDANFKPTFNAAKSGADPSSRTDALDEIKAGEDRRHNCYTITFDGPLDLECDETNRGVWFFGAQNRDGQKLSRVSVERFTRPDGETVLRFTYRFPRFQEKGFYDIQLNCKTPAAP